MPMATTTERTPNIAAHHIVAGVLAFMEHETFSGSLKDIHTTFSQLKEENPELFGEFVFSTGQNFPYSKLLERVLSELMHSDVIEASGKVNPGQMTYLVPENRKMESRDFLTHRYGQTDVTLIETFNNMAIRFEELCPERG